MRSQSDYGLRKCLYLVKLKKQKINLAFQLKLFT